MLPASAPLAFISDIHGNLEALQAVLKELSRRHISEVFVAGDLLWGGDHPLEVWKTLQQINARCIQGLSDAALAALDPKSISAISPKEKEKLENFERTRQQLGQLIIERIRRLPQQLRIPMVDGNELLMVHGSPYDQTTEITHDLDDETILRLIDDDPATIVVCGASHVPFQRQIEDVSIINVGSVGQAPEGNAAHFTVISPKIGGAIIEQNWVDL